MTVKVLEESSQNLTWTQANICEQTWTCPTLTWQSWRGPAERKVRILKSSCDIKPSKCAACLSLPEGGTVSLSSPPSPVLRGGGCWLEKSSGSKWAPPTAAILVYVCVCVLLGGSHDPCVWCPSLTRWVSGFWVSKWFVCCFGCAPPDWR